MSGRDTHTYNNLSRRDFIKRSLLTASALSLVPLVSATSCSAKHTFTGGMVNDNSGTGHLIRQGFKGKPTKTIEVPIVIVGGGVSGLSAAWHLNENKLSDFLVFDLAAKEGGNAVSGSNRTSSFPWAAHYLPIVNNSNSDLIRFLKQQNIITGFDEKGLPIYNEYYLCFDPEERLFINGHWQDGLVPSFGVPEAEKAEIAAFFKLVEDYKHQVGSDGKPAFEIPLSDSSQDAEFKDLDKQSFYEFLQNKKWNSSYLHWYLNYCCKDDYGSTLQDTSAYAGLHYFCARRAKAANAESSAVLTWPEGNAFLVNRLAKELQSKIRTNQLITSVNLLKDKVEVIAYNALTKECIAYHCEQVILATPQYINRYVLPADLYPALALQAFEYSPWMVANITVTGLSQHKGEPLSWDNVMYHSKSLGYVNACHQHLNRYENHYVLTYYLPLTDLPSKQARHAIMGKSYESWTQEILEDLKPAHPDIESMVTGMEVRLWGHGMIKPKPGFISGKEREQAAHPIGEKIFLAHTDLAGISIFEEAFAQGIKAANAIINIHAKTTGA
jgi:predicted NAD/FAD-binding protein